METERSFKERLLAAYESVSYLQKKGYNEGQRFHFVQEAEVKRAVQAALREQGLYIAQVEAEPVGTVLPHSAVVRTTVVITDGKDSVSMTGIGSGTDLRKDGTPCGDKSVMKAMAASLKYALTSGFLIATGDDPEEDGGSAREEAAADALLSRLRSATPEQALALKSEVALFRDGARFPELVAAYKAATSGAKDGGK